MLEIGKVKDKRAPILRGDEVVAVLSASNWKEEAVLTRGEVIWNLRSRRGKRLIGTLSTDPQVSDTGEQARFLAEQTSWWRGTWDRRASSAATTAAVAGGAAAAGSS
ncbi:MAG: hypothetical protein M3R66_02530 [Actinomycetota bacterium]|nr:hypothetical protein [Actinomycetota bacterium]